ncbi:sodium:solute symporter [Saccharomonospora sp. CUA-673]|uniref:sodium:solute symporter n=1 Tax=Saccharomonospora sp. CUA-673 TaxID=1904969 RepID=UPI000963FD85|nr:sodium:solute symporter [Saccharomonospora sp. CUA-673]OLT45931.1 sodium:solute symporter [Saccharomonospora sp. CUA-673]
MAADYAVIALYIAGMIGIGWYSLRLAKTRGDYLVAGRRLGGVMYAGTMSAVVLGGASTIGGVGLGYTYGISGAWLVLTIGLGILVLHTVFARRLVRLKLTTVSELLHLRYGGATPAISGVVMWGYTLMLTVTSMLAFATIFSVLYGLPTAASVAIGGGIVVFYAALGGMWSITLTDMAQFVIMTIGFLLILLPMTLSASGGFSGMEADLDADFFSFTSIGGATIVTYVLVYGFGLLIGQDIWQRVFTARSPKVATAGGITSALYCVVYALAGAVIGMAAKALYPNLGNADDAFATVVNDLLPTGVRGLVLAAALSALMSTASGALLACSTVTTSDLLPRLLRRGGDTTADTTGENSGDTTTSGERGGVAANRITTLVLGLGAIGISMLVSDVVAALTVAYNILVGGLLVAILGALLWRRGTRAGALASMVTGTVVVIVSMITQGLMATEPIYFGLGASLVAYVVVSLATPRTPDSELDTWRRRLAGTSER